MYMRILILFLVFTIIFSLDDFCIILFFRHKQNIYLNVLCLWGENVNYRNT